MDLDCATYRVAGYLPEYRHADDTNQTSAGRMAIPQLTVVPPSLIGRILFDLMLHLLHLKGHHRVVDIALAVVFSKNRLGSFDFAMCHEPTRTFWQPPHTTSHNNRRHQLAPDRDAEALMTVDIRTAVNHPMRRSALWFAPYKFSQDSPRSNNRPYIPRAVIQTCDGPAPCGMSHLAHVARSRNATERDTEAQQEATAQEHPAVDRRSLNASTNDDDHSPGEHTHAPAEVVVDGPGQEHSRD